MRFQEDDSSYTGLNNLEIVKRKKEIAARIDQKINAIKAKKSMKTQQIPSLVTPSKFDESDYSIESNYDDFKVRNSLNENKGSETPVLKTRKTQYIPKKNQSEMLKPDLLESANKLQNKKPNGTFISKQMNNVGSFKNSNGNKNKGDL